jgi:hypothetical protein
MRSRGGRHLTSPDTPNRIRRGYWAAVWALLIGVTQYGRDQDRTN